MTVASPGTSVNRFARIAATAVSFMVVTALGTVLAALLLPGALGLLASPLAFVAAFFAARKVWEGTAEERPGLVTAVLVGALVTGGIGFAAGFFGPMILSPSSNQGPLLGILITGPAGLLIGAVLGAVLWFRRG
jgi:hypothetical protein